jgi:hypothetical protein
LSCDNKNSGKLAETSPALGETVGWIYLFLFRAQNQAVSNVNAGGSPQRHFSVKIFFFSTIPAVRHGMLEFLTANICNMSPYIN